MDNRLAKRQVNSIALSIILLTSTFTIFGAFMFFPIQEADAQGLQLRISAAERPQFQNRFFGAQIVQVVIDDPSAPDPDDNTVGLQVRGVSVGRVHLQDGLWYHFFAEEDAFGIYLDVTTDGVRDSVISVSNPVAGLDAASNPSPFNIGATAYTQTGARTDSFVTEMTRVGTTIFAELDQVDIFPTLPNAFCDGNLLSTGPACPAANTNPNINIPGDAAEADDAGNVYHTAGAAAFNTFGSTAQRSQIDWPYIQLIPVEETDIVSIRAGSASVDLIFDDFAAGISTKVDRTAAYPVNSEIIVSFTDNMWNINPVEEDLVFFALNANTGSPSSILVQPVRGFNPDGTGFRGAGGGALAGQNFPDIFGTTSVGAFAAIDFDGRQVLELDAPEGLSSVLYLNALDVSSAVAAAPTDIPAGIVRQFATEPFTHDSTNARALGAALNFGAVAAEFIDNSGNGGGAATAAVGDLPTILVIESDPNTSFFESINEASGSRADIFAGANDRVASFDYFDIIASAPMTQHDGFAAVDREIYNSADRQVITVTDPDQNLRSRISETLDARLSKSFIPVGVPIPIINTRVGATIFDQNLNRVNNIYEANFLTAGADGVIFGLDAADGSFLRVDANGNLVIADEGAPPAEAGGGGLEVFHADGTAAGGPDIELVPGNPADTNANDFAALRFRTNGVTGIADGASGIIIDTNIPLSTVDDLATSITLTGQQILDQVRLDNQGDGTADNLENFLEEVARIYVDADGDGVFDAGELVVARTADIAAGTTYRVDIPLYNLIHIDTTLVNFITAPFTTVVQVQAVRNACATSAVVGTAFNADGTTANNCVIATATANANRIGATQIVDFTPFQAGDTDGDNNSVNDDAYTDADLLDPLTGLVFTGYNRDPLTNGARVGTGSFRVLDLVDTVNAAALAGVTLDNTVLRFTILFLDNQAVPEPAEIISRANTISTMLLDIGGMMVTFNPPSSATAPDAAVMDRAGTFNNFVYRLETDEASSNSSIFSASADYFTVNQFDTIQDLLNEQVPTGDPIRLWMPGRFIPPDRLAATYFDNDIVAFFRSVSATYIYETVDGAVEWDRSSYSFGQDAFLTLTDEDLNRRPDAIERYNLNNDGFMFFELGTGTTANERVDTACAVGVASCFNNQIDATLLETGPNTGTFVAQITMPATTLVDTTPGAAPAAIIRNTNQGDIEANYLDIRDISSNTLFTFTSIANIRTTLGDVVLDRAAYPPGAIVYVEIHDNDFNTDVDIRENINLRQVVITTTTTGAAGSAGAGWAAAPGLAEGTQLAAALPAACNTIALFVTNACASARPIVEVNVFTANGARLFSMLPVGLFNDLTQAAGPGIAGAIATRFGTGITTTAANSVLPMLNRNGQPTVNAQETGPNTGIFEFEIRMPGPANADQFPITLPAILTAGTLAAPVIRSNQPIQVTFLDPADSAGDTDDVEELATFLTNTSRLRTDKLEYGLGENIQVMIEEPDLNLDSRNIENIAFTVLDLVTDKFDTEFGAGNFGTAIAAAGVSTDLPNFRETAFNSAVFSVIIEDVPQTLIDRGEVGRLIYLDQTPSGSGTQIRIQYNFLIVAILPEIIFDKEEYTPFDEVIVSIISPDSNSDRDRIETLNRVVVSSSSQSIGNTRQFIETGPNTGIFEEDFDLHPTAGVRDLQAIREDGVTVEFRIDTDTVATKSVFVNFHVGQVMFDKDAFRLNERGVMRVIDPDANRNPDTIDTLAVRFWSTTDRGGLNVVLRETGDRTGIFEEIVTFTPDEESTGTRLRVTEGDTITAKYTDNSLPAPAALAADSLSTVEVEELFASALIGAIVPPLERAVASDPELVDQTGAILADVSAGSQVLIQSTITNSQTKKQPFAYIVQIKDSDGVVTSLSWVTGELPAKESLAAAQSWIPEVSGSYTVEVFVWASVDNPTALSPVRTTTVTVS